MCNLLSTACSQIKHYYCPPVLYIFISYGSGQAIFSFRVFSIFFIFFYFFGGASGPWHEPWPWFALYACVGRRFLPRRMEPREAQGVQGGKWAAPQVHRRNTRTDIPGVIHTQKETMLQVKL